MLRTELSAGDELRIVEGETVDRMKSDLHLPDTDSLAKDSLQKIQKMIGGDYVVLGSYTDLGKDSGGKIRMDVRLEDARSGETLTSKAETGTVDTMFEMVSRTGSDVRSVPGARPISTEEAVEVRATLPRNPDAARLYSQALATPPLRRHHRPRFPPEIYCRRTLLRALPFRACCRLEDVGLRKRRERRSAKSIQTCFESSGVRNGSPSRRATAS